VLFVYGTLLEGEAHHARLAGARALGAARTSAEYALFDRGEYPALARGGATSVLGELYAIDEALTAELDRFEEHPTLFERGLIRLSDGREVEGYVYAGPLSGARPIDSGCYRSR
jgi:gamma-glutamylcyclotransferase (GGCT)/AIG2-like uncharacterized protein YtfP